jgi:hypothetical protein
LSDYYHLNKAFQCDLLNIYEICSNIADLLHEDRQAVMAKQIASHFCNYRVDAQNMQRYKSNTFADYLK